MSFVKEMVLRETREVQDYVFTELVEKAAMDRRQLPEEIFVKEFLPYFAGEPVPEGRQNTMALWIGIAGSPTAEVTVINNKGEALFNVPPVLDTSFLAAARSNNVLENYDRIVDHSNLISNNIPDAGSTFLETALTDKLKQMTANRHPSDAQDRWQDIIKRYRHTDTDQAQQPADQQHSALSDEVYE